MDTLSLRYTKVVSLLIAIAILSSCGEAEPVPIAPSSEDALVVELKSLRDTARAAAEAEADEPRIDAAREAAEGARAILTSIRDAHVSEDVDDPAPVEAVMLVVDAERWARVADERTRLADDLDGFIAGGYRKARGAGIKAVFKSLGFAARRVDEHGVENLPQAVVDTAERAAVLARNIGAARETEAGTTDWGALADDMDAYADDPPAALRQIVALAWLTIGQSGVALVELETIDPAEIDDPKQRAGHHLLRGLLYRLRGYPTLGGVELDAAAEYDEQLAAYGPEMQSGAYLLIAAMRIRDGRYGDADRWIADAIRVWPDNPLAVYITGERLAETGEYEAAAESLEKAAADSDLAWVAEKVAERARQMRDGEHAGEPLLDDPSFLRKLALRYVLEFADQSEPAAKLRELLEATRSLGGRLIDKIPGIGDESDAPE